MSEHRVRALGDETSQWDKRERVAGPPLPRTAGERWAALDFTGSDTLSPLEAGIDMAWPEPGEACMDVLATAQLYWPALGPGVDIAGDKNGGTIARGHTGSGFADVLAGT